jgi:hypothetical protein
MKTTAWAFDDRWRYRDLGAFQGKGRSAGTLATAAWLAARGLLVAPRTPWDVSIVLDIVTEDDTARGTDLPETRFHIAISSTEWGFYFAHNHRASWIRVTDAPFIHQRDDFALLFKVPPLRDLGRLVRALEETYGVRFRRRHAAVRTNISNAEPVIREWVCDDI